MKEKEFAYITGFSSNVYKSILAAGARISTISTPRSYIFAMPGLDFQEKILRPPGLQVFIFGRQDKYSSRQKLSSRKNRI